MLRCLAPGERRLLITADGFRPAPRQGARRDILLADLLGRPAVNLDTPELQRFLAGKRVLVTGAGGSIGSEICRQMMRFLPQRVILVERAENNLFEIDRELRERWVGAEILPCIADVCDRRRVGEIFRAEKPHVVFHCAAHKHVPMMEHNPCEAIKNNIFGTKTVADAAMGAGTSAFVLISTDKAVNPSSVMGATKRMAELYIQSLNAEKGTRFLAVRFGNVLGSSGSVVPIFQKQIEAGGPVTVTHPDMQRYFMTIPEASQLVMQAGAIGHGGEVLLLDMGSPVKIVDLARQLIVRNGLKPDDDILITFSGIRQGEKLYEELACDDEQTRPTSHEKIRAWQLPAVSARHVAAHLAILAHAADASSREAVTALMKCVPEYQLPSSKARKNPRLPLKLAIPGLTEVGEAA
jgi:FlaA1/EpsC-like NDP-sugar epimerase